MLNSVRSHCIRVTWAYFPPSSGELSSYIFAFYPDPEEFTFDILLECN